MKIGIEVSPLTSGHRVRGIGFYLKNLLTALKKYHPEHEYLEFTGNNIPVHADVVHYPYFDPFSLTLPLFGSKKTIVTVHDLTPLILPQLFPVGLKGKIKWQLQKYALQHVQRVITDSHASAADIARLASIQQSKIDVVYLAPGQQFKKTLSSKNTHIPFEKFALYVGDATPNKNIVRLIKATVQAKVPLVVVGKVFTDTTLDTSHPWTRDVEEFRNIAKKNSDKVKMLGFVSDEDLVALYNKAAVFVMPSLYEGFGLPVVEAMACATPVVCSDKGSLKEVAANAALFIDPYNVDDIAGMLKKVFTDRKTAEIQSNQGLVRVKEFSWEKTAQQTVLAYKKAL